LNHIATYVALAAAVMLLDTTTASTTQFKRRPLIALVLSCVIFFTALQLAWFVAEINGVLRVP
jgi:hypothetical protein